MEKYLIQGATLQGIADAIRAKKGTGGDIKVTDFASEISDMKASADGVKAEELFVTPSDGVQEFTPSDGEYYSRVTVEAIPIEYVKPSGTKTVTENGTHDVTAFASVNVQVQNGGASAGRRIIEVDTLPTESIDENAVYQCGGAYYTGAFGFHDLISVYGGMVGSMKSSGFEEVSFNIIAEQTTEGILTSDPDAYVFHLYYIEIEENAFMYVDGEWISAAALFGVPFLGKIADVNEIDTDSYGIYALIGPQWTQFNSETVDVDELPKIGVEGAIYNITKCIGTAFVLIGTANTVTTYDNGVACFEATSENYEDIAVPEGMNTAICYVTDIPDIYVYDTDGWKSFSTFVRDAYGVEIPFLGEIRYQADVNTEKNGYYACIVRELYQYRDGEFERLISEAEAAVTANELFVTPTEGVQEFTPPDGAYYSGVTVEAIPNGYVKPSGGKNITANGTHDVTNVKEAIVNVPIPEGYVKPEGALTVTENVTDMDITDKKTLTVYVDEAPYNIHVSNVYAPADTGAIWIKEMSQPTKISFDSRVLSYQTGVTAETLSATLKTPAYRTCCAAVGSKIYILGEGAHPYTTIQVFDTATQTAETLSASLPSDLCKYLFEGVCCAAVGSKIYMFGGRVSDSIYDFTDTVLVFDTASNTVSSLENVKLPLILGYATAAAVGDKIYIIGGQTSDGVHMDQTLIFDTVSNTFSTLDEGLARRGACSVAVGEKIYIFGGANGSTLSSDITLFDVQNSTFYSKGYMYHGRKDASAVLLGNKIYIIGGSRYAGVAISLDTIGVYNIEEERMEPLEGKLPAPRSLLYAAAVGDKVYVLGGTDYDAKCADGIYTFSAFDASFALPANELLIEMSTQRNFFYLLPNMRIGVSKAYVGDQNGQARRVPVYTYSEYSSKWTESFSD